MLRRPSAVLLLFLTTLGAALIPGLAPALDADNPFAVVAKAPSSPVAPGSVVDLVVEYQVLKDHFIYRDMSSVEVVNAAGLSAQEAQFPPGKVKFDKVSEMEREVFLENFQVTVPVAVPADAAPGARQVGVEAKWQGCNIPKNYCLFPAREQLVFALTVAGGATVPSVEGATSAPVGSGVAGATGGEGGGETASGSEAAPSGAESAGSAPISQRPLGSADAASSACSGVAGSKGAGAGGLIDRILGSLSEAVAMGGKDGEGQEALSGLSLLRSGSFLTVLFIVFLGGIASSFTPCVYPMIPITVSVIGASADQGRLKCFYLTVVYVAGICATYTVLGLFAAKTGGMFGEALQDWRVLAGVALVMVALAAAMFGAYEFALPTGVTTRASQAGGEGSLGAFVVGIVAGIVAAPCTGPIVAFLLLWIAESFPHSLLPGFLVMLAYSLGLGMLFLVIGTFAGTLASMPRSGPWMVTVKKVFGAVLVAVAVYYIDQAVTVAYGKGEVPGLASSVVTGLWVFTIVLGAGVAAGSSVSLAGGDANVRLFASGKPIRLLLGVCLLAGGLWTLRGGEAEAGMVWSGSHEDGLVRAQAESKPVILDFTADWCAACKELEHFTYTDPAVMDCAAEFVPVMIDGTRSTPEFEALKDRYGFRGLPAVYFICPDGSVVDELTLTGFEPADRFLTKMNQALNTCGSG